MSTSAAADRTRPPRRVGASACAPGDVVLVAGDVGTGKTTFVRGACRGLGVSEPVTSPSFTIGQRYEGRVPVSHVDLFRLDTLEGEDPALLDDYLDAGLGRVRRVAAGAPRPRLEPERVGAAHAARAPRRRSGAQIEATGAPQPGRAPARRRSATSDASSRRPALTLVGFDTSLAPTSACCLRDDGEAFCTAAAGRRSGCSARPATPPSCCRSWPAAGRAGRRLGGRRVDRGRRRPRHLHRPADRGRHRPRARAGARRRAAAGLVAGGARGRHLPSVRGARAGRCCPDRRPARPGVRRALHRPARQLEPAWGPLALDPEDLDRARRASVPGTPLAPETGR